MKPGKSGRKFQGENKARKSQEIHSRKIRRKQSTFFRGPYKARNTRPQNRPIQQGLIRGLYTRPTHKPSPQGRHSRPTHQGAGQSTAPQYQATGTQAGQESRAPSKARLTHTPSSHARSTHSTGAARAPRQAAHLHQMKDATPCTTCMWYSSSIEAGG